jgi:hypothetical protein
MSDLYDTIEEAYKEEETSVEEENIQSIEQEPEGKVEPEEEEEVQGSVGEGGGVPAEDNGDTEAKAEGEEDPDPVKSEGSGAASKAPIDWDAGMREHWGKLDPAVQDKITAREGQMARAMQGTSQARQTAGELQNLANQYGSVIAAEGASSPLHAVQGLLQTTTELRMGTPQQKATRMAELINHFGVDITMLDSAIVGEPVVNTEMAGMQQMIDQRLAPVNQMMQQLGHMQQQKQFSQQSSVQNEVAEFKKDAEFLEDVRQDMGYLINLATQQGREMTLKDAYGKACAMNPQISGVMAARDAAAKLTNGKANMASKKNAASSIAGKGQGGSSAAPVSLHGQLNAAWDDLAG